MKICLNIFCTNTHTSARTIYMLICKTIYAHNQNDSGYKNHNNELVTSNEVIKGLRDISFNSSLVDHSKEPKLSFLHLNFLFN